MKIKNSKKKIYNKKIIVEKRYNFLIAIIILLNLVLVINLFKIQILENDKYLLMKEKLSKKIIEGNTAPRGRIYDRNGVLIVDNVPIKTIVYKKLSGTTLKDEINLAYNLSDILELDINKLKINDLKKFWIVNNQELANKKITDEEWSKLKSRELTTENIDSLKLERVTNEDISEYTDKDKKAAYIYYLMNNGYSYDTKIIKSGDEISDFEYAYISENISKLKGINTSLDWKRNYLYGNVFRSILGNISNDGIPADLKNNYLLNGYNLSDKVGISYLEYQYDDYLRGKKDIYELFNNGVIKLKENGNRGNDLYLTIDINLQMELEKILENQVLITKSEPNTEYYNRSFVVITDPNTGEILAMSGKQIVNSNDGYKIVDYTPGLLTSPVAVGSVVKGASHIVGYNTGALSIGEVREDSCIKIMSTKEKCSWTYLGYLDDIEALKYSSNTYQFRTAINVGGGNYYYDGPLKIDPNAFNIYRNTFNQFGLGVKTGIDLPKESVGNIGTKVTPGLLLDFSIGQYDTYTALQLSQYISTIANGGKRMKLQLLKSVHSSIDDSVLYEYNPVVLNEVETTGEFMDRVRYGFRQVILGGTGYGYIDYIYNASGKTGTSQSFLDSDLDGMIDKETLTNTFVAYAPSDNPIVTFTVISPDYTHYYNDNYYQSGVNRRISYEVSKKFFEIYK